MKNWQWKKEVEKNRVKIWSDGTLEKGQLTTWSLYKSSDEDEAVATLWKDWHSKDWTLEWRCNVDATYYQVLPELSISEAKRFAEEIFEEEILGDAIQNVKPTLSQSITKRM